jgi:hypothetical protein
MYLLREIPKCRVYGELPNGVGEGTMRASILSLIFIDHCYAKVLLL